MVSRCLDRFKIIYGSKGERVWELRNAGGEEAVMNILEDLLAGLDVLEIAVKSL